MWHYAHVWILNKTRYYHISYNYQLNDLYVVIFWSLHSPFVLPFCDMCFWFWWFPLGNIPYLQRHVLRRNIQICKSKYNFISSKSYFDLTSHVVLIPADLNKMGCLSDTVAIRLQGITAFSQRGVLHWSLFLPLLSYLSLITSLWKLAALQLQTGNNITSFLGMQTDCIARYHTISNRAQ